MGSAHSRHFERPDLAYSAIKSVRVICEKNDKKRKEKRTVDAQRVVIAGGATSSRCDGAHDLFADRLLVVPLERGEALDVVGGDEAARFLPEAAGVEPVGLEAIKVARADHRRNAERALANVGLAAVARSAARLLCEIELKKHRNNIFLRCTLAYSAINFASPASSAILPDLSLF